MPAPLHLPPQGQGARSIGHRPAAAVGGAAVLVGGADMMMVLFFVFLKLVAPLMPVLPCN